MTSVLRMYMSSSSSPMDEAWSYLQNDDKIEKFLPLVVPLAFGAYGAFRGAGGRFTDDEGKFNPNLGGKAKVVDPLTGGFLYEQQLGDSTGDRVLGALTGAAQGLNPLTYVRGAGAALRGVGALGAKRLARGAGSRLAARGARADEARRRAAAVEAAGDVAPASAFQPIQTIDYRTITPEMQRIAALRSSAQQARNLTGAGTQTRVAQKLQRYGKSPTRFTPATRLGRKAGFAGRALQQGGPLVGLGAGMLANYLMGDNGVAPPNTSGFNYAGGSGSGQGNVGVLSASGGAASGFGTTSNMNNLSSQFSNRTAGQEIFDPNAFRGNQRARAFEGQSEFTGF